MWRPSVAEGLAGGREVVSVPQFANLLERAPGPLLRVVVGGIYFGLA